MSTPSRTPAFRADIEGLRAIAVLLVVACHAKLPGLEGAFVGVDVFFVISGYLVTRILFLEWERQGHIRLGDFYARRIRRLLPAFWVMLLFVVGAIWVIYSPIEQFTMLPSALSAALYFSNFHYAVESTDYMAPSAKLDPLLHTWSLGVEEQFYLLWPLLLMAVFRLGKGRTDRWRPLAVLIAVLGLTSFVACVYLTDTRQPIAFFLPFTRSWEFCLGAAIVLLERWHKEFLATTNSAWRPQEGLLAASATTGMALILLPAMLLTSKSTFPGTSALLPASGTALLLLIVPLLPTGSLTSRVLAWQPMQWLGARSYSWYLWHWPMLVLGREIAPGQGLARDVALATTALLAAHLSYAVVENPLRRSRHLRQLGLAFAFAVLLPFAGFILIKGAGEHAMEYSRTPPFERLSATMTDLPLIYADSTCDEHVYSTRVILCTVGAAKGEKTAVLFGDSHAGQWFSAMHQIMRAAGWKLIVITKSACPIIDEVFFYERIGRDFTECAIWRNKAVVNIHALRPDLVVVSSSEDYPFTDAQWTGGIQRMMTAIAGGTRQLVILRDTPSPGFDPLACLARKEWNPQLSWQACSFDWPPTLSPLIQSAHQRAVRSAPNIRLVDMNPHVCTENPCEVSAGATIKFRDANHLSDTFVKSLAPQLKAALENAEALAR